MYKLKSHYITDCNIIKQVLVIFLESKSVVMKIYLYGEYNIEINAATS